MDTVTPQPTPDTQGPRPLLPPVLSGPAAFLWLWALPLGVLLLLNVQGYWIIEGNMDPGQRRMALIFGLSGLANLLGGFALYIGTAWLARNPECARARHPLWGLPAIAAQVAYLWFAVSSADSLLPVSVTAWIYPPERFLFNQFAFAMLPLFLGILRLACARPEKGFGAALSVSVGAAISAPVVLYFVLDLARWFSLPSGGAVIFVVTAIILLGLVMFIGIVRSLMLALRFAKNWGGTGELIAIVLFALVLPLGGLLLNRSIPFPVDFQAWEVYALVCANTAILLLASQRHAQWPRLSFNLLCATLPFSLYFFIVFLPYTPLSILAVLAMGVGFLVLTPTCLFTLHLHLLNKARVAVQPAHGWSRLALGGFLSFLVLPAFFTVRGLADKAALNAALDYLFTPSIHSGSIQYPANCANLRRALASHRSYKNGIYYPLLSDYYSWLVFDDLVLPDDKLARLEKTFLGSAGSTRNFDPFRSQSGSFFGTRSVRDRTRMPGATPPPRTVEVSDLDVRVLPSDGPNAVITLALTLQNTGQAAAEYRKILPLPAGVFVTGFRLHINGTPVPGRIFEKKTALWVYAMIRDSERRDPGILVYNQPDELELRVFPVGAGIPTTVEIDFLAPSQVEFPRRPAATKDPAAILAALGGKLRPQIASDSRGCLVAGGLSAHALPAVEREPYLHLIVDRSADNGFTGDLPAALRNLQKRFPDARRARVTVANYNVTDLVARLTPIGDLFARQPPDLDRVLPLSGGLALDLALAQGIRQHCEAELDGCTSMDRIPPRPIFVILSRKAGPRTLVLDLANAWLDLLPGLELHELGADGVLVTHRECAVSVRPLLRIGNSVRPLVPGVAARFKAVAESDRLEYWDPATSAWAPVPDANRQASSTPWSRAVSLQLQQQDHARDPGGSGIDLKALVKASRESGVLLAATSYIVVENSAQWRMLELSERQKIGQNAALDFREAPTPPALIIGLGLGLWILLRRGARPRDRTGAANGRDEPLRCCGPRAESPRRLPAGSELWHCGLRGPAIRPVRPPW